MRLLNNSKTSRLQIPPCTYHTVVNRPRAEYPAVSLMTVLLTMVSLAGWFPVYGETTVGNWIHAGGENVLGEALTPSDVLARVKRVQGELELIRFEMGKPKAGPAHASVTQTVPREAYFQALTLFDKADRLMFEPTGELGSELIKIPPEAVHPEHVWKVVDAALQRVLQVKENLTLTQSMRQYRTRHWA